MADDLDNRDDSKRIRWHAYDHNGIRVTCLLSLTAPYEELCMCGHTVVASSPGAALVGLSDHVAWAEKASLHG